VQINTHTSYYIYNCKEGNCCFKIYCFNCKEFSPSWDFLLHTYIYIYICIYIYVYIYIYKQFVSWVRNTSYNILLTKFIIPVAHLYNFHKWKGSPTWFCLANPSLAYDIQIVLFSYGRSSNFHAFINFILGFSQDVTLEPLLFHDYSICYEIVWFIHKE
jgi:hypothetical protein